MRTRLSHAKNNQNKMLLVGALAVGGAAAAAAAAAGGGATALYIRHRRKKTENARFFGKDLALLKQNQLDKNTGLPIPVNDCIARLIDDEEALKSEGFLRISGSKATVESLMSEYDAGNRPNLSDTVANDVASLLTHYFRELPKCVLTNGNMCYDALLASHKAHYENEERWDKNIGKVLSVLPDLNKKCLKALFEFLHKVSLYGEYSKMHVENIAICIAPNLIFYDEEELNLKGNEAAMKFLMESPDITNMIARMISRTEKLFLD